MQASVTTHWRGEILKAWGNPRLVADAALGAFLPFSIRTHLVDEEEHETLTLEDWYPSYKRCTDIGVMAGEMKDGDPEAFIAKLNEKLAETFKDTIYTDDDDNQFKLS